MNIDFGDSVLETKRLLLRPLELSDAQSMYELAKDPIVAYNTGFTPHESAEYTRGLIAKSLGSPKNRAIILKEIGELVGVIGLMPARIDGHGNEGELGYWLGMPYWGKGIMPEAVNVATEYAFNTLGIPAVWIRCITDNNNSRRVAEKCGFTCSFTATGERTDGSKAEFWHYFKENPHIENNKQRG